MVRDYQILIDQLRHIKGELRDHLGKSYYPMLYTLKNAYNYILFVFLDVCENCCFPGHPGQNMLAKLYHNTIQDIVLKKLIEVFSDYYSWYILKETSPIKDLLKTYKIPLPVPMTLKTLKEALIKIFHDQDMFAKNNQQIVILNKEFQGIFPDNLVFLPELHRLLYAHVEPCSEPLGISTQSAVITEELDIMVPSDILYQDPSSLFWIPDNLNLLLNDRQKLAYTWIEILNLFKSYIAANLKTYMKNSEFISLTSTPLYEFFPCTHIHPSQVETLLKEHAVFIGRKTYLPNICPQMKFRKAALVKDTLLWLEEIINKPHLPKTYATSPAVLFSSVQPTGKPYRLPIRNCESWSLDV